MRVAKELAQLVSEVMTKVIAEVVARLYNLVPRVPLNHIGILISDNH
jgi:hypothetical protein